jgi:hypothetical protein
VIARIPGASRRDERDEVKAAPYILALRGDHEVAGSGDELYVKKLRSNTGARYSVMHVDQPLKDPDSGRKSGLSGDLHRHRTAGHAPGPRSRATLTDSARETLQGDVLISENAQPDERLSNRTRPHGPMSGVIVAVVDNARTRPVSTMSWRSIAARRWNRARQRADGRGIPRPIQ